MTPLLYACSTGCSDVVKLLCEKRANIRAQSQGRGALQLANATAGANNKLVKYLQEKYPDLPMTDAVRTRQERNRRGHFSSMVRDITGPARDRGENPHTASDRQESAWHGSAGHESAWHGSAWHGSAWHEGGDDWNEGGYDWENRIRR